MDEVKDLEEAIDEAQLIILATPVNAVMQLLPAVLDRVKDQVVLDVGSTK